jgi:hypothetical protein
MKTGRIFGMLVAGLLLLASLAAVGILDFTANILPAESLGRYHADISQNSASGLSAERMIPQSNPIFLYPQAQKVQITNPRGCYPQQWGYDWWSYLSGTADTYATKQGPQMKAVYAMLKRMAEGVQPRCEDANQPPVFETIGCAFAKN